jgi:hypothetical protein
VVGIRELLSYMGCGFIRFSLDCFHFYLIFIQYHLETLEGVILILIAVKRYFEINDIFFFYNEICQLVLEFNIK